MAEAYAAYAAQVSGALALLLEDTGVRVQPAVDFVACGCGLQEHYVPASALERHLFYYGTMVETQQQTLQGGLPVAAEGEQDIQGDSGELQSLLEPETTTNSAREDASGTTGLSAAILQTADTAGGLYERVRGWKRIPRPFAQLAGPERDLVEPSALRRWLKAELSRPGVLPDDEPLDEELVEYVAGLLDHPDFCQPDLLVLELHEFLGGSVTNFVLALWKFLVVEIALKGVFQLDTHGVGNGIQTKTLDSTKEKSVALTTPRDSNTPQKDESASTAASRNYKRRRASYRGKVGTKTGPAAFREMICKHMVELSQETGRDLIGGGGFDDTNSGMGSSKSRRQELRGEAVKWYRNTDALEVRNRRRPGKMRSPSRDRPRSRPSPARSRHVREAPTTSAYRGRSRQRSRSPRSRGRPRERRHSPSRSRSRSRSRRDRSQRRSPSRYHDSSRKGSASPNHERSQGRGYRHGHGHRR